MGLFSRRQHKVGVMPAPHAPRARRHAFRLPVEYRVSGERHWNSAVTANLSCTGALLENGNGSTGLRVGDEFELRLVLPPQLAGDATVPLLCTARVVRLENIGHGRHARVAAAILRYRLEAPLAGIAPDVDSVRGVRHEVNNSLTAIVGSAELLLLNEEDEFTRSQLECVRDSALRAARALRRLRADVA